jgi:hypothetical protein
VNELYAMKKYLRRENYIDKPLNKLINVIDYYFCFTKYCKNILIKKNINNDKIIYFHHNIIKFKKNKVNEINKKYILFDIDSYSYKENIILLEIWLKYYIDSHYILIIYLKSVYDKISNLLLNLIKSNVLEYNNDSVYFYKNIIISSNRNEIDKYDYFVVILNLSKYSLYTMVNYYLLKNKIVIVNKNNIIKNSNCANQLFVYSDFSNINEMIELLDNVKHYPNNVLNKNKINKLLSRFEFIDYDVLTVSNNSNSNSNSNNINIKSIKESYEKMSKIMNKIDNKFLKVVPYNIKEYYTWLKYPKNKTDYCYATLICINNTYLGSVLVAGYKLKQITKFNIICFVQNKPYYEDNKLKFSGLTTNEINKIKKIYDGVIGIDILNSKYKNIDINNIHYKNQFYYCTKIICFGFIEYKKMFYYDASVMINHNIDNIFKFYKSMYLNMLKIKGDLHGGCIYIIPKIYYIKKIIYLLEHYEELFIKNNFISHCNFDEDLIFYTIYPNWDNNNLKKILNIGNNYYRRQYIDLYQPRTIYSIEIYAIQKPFRYSNYLKEYERDFFNLNHTCYLSWDETIKELIIVYPTLKKYFKSIKTFRNTLF